jgi:SAM-dependent methyltransferase
MAGLQKVDVSGFVPTPPELVDCMVANLFQKKPPNSSDTLLDPGCGTGSFISGILRWCKNNRAALPKIIGVELDSSRAELARSQFCGIKQVEIRQADFLEHLPDTYDYVIGNPPYVPIYGISEPQKFKYRASYDTARGRFDLYLLFFERALKSLKTNGRLVFVTPEKFLYVETAAPLRRLLSTVQVEHLELIDEQTFGDRVTYPTITTVVNRRRTTMTKVRVRDGTERNCDFRDSLSWMPHISGADRNRVRQGRLSDACRRISCGVATGADDVFVRRMEALKPELANFAHPTIAGRELTGTEEIRSIRPYGILTPYTRQSSLLDEDELGALGRYLETAKDRLLKRVCARRKPWYAFHETPALADILRPKILCKDITEKPRFWIDRKGVLVPRHSVYYIVPLAPTALDELCSFLNSAETSHWLRKHCQRAANGFLRLQSNILKEIPMPADLVRSALGPSALPRQLGLPDLAPSEGFR